MAPSYIRQYESRSDIGISDESPCFSEEDLAPSYIRQYESRSDIGISDESPCLSEEELAPSYIRQCESRSNHRECAPQLPCACELSFSSPSSSIVMEMSSFIVSSHYQEHPTGKEYFYYMFHILV